jgi:hypothetical protein
VPLLLALLLLGCPTSARTDDDDDTEAPDSDGDGVPDGEDGCPNDPTDSVDSDGDGHCDSVDGCPEDPTGWTDADSDTHCDEADDACPEDSYQWTDADADGHCDEVDDDCTEDPAGWTDFDGDAHCDEEDDACPTDPLQWTDADGDGFCDEVDDDCPDDPDGFSDTNGDGLCDEFDDTDGDGIPDAEETEYGSDCAISDPFNPDTDGDGIDDNADSYPRDPFPEYLLWRNDGGDIDFVLSNRDGTFQAPAGIGMPYGDTGNTDYRYTGFVISDFDNNGRTDFLAYGDADPSDPTNPLDLWWFGRITGPGSFAQRLIDPALSGGFISAVADLDNDERIDVVQAVRNPGPANITTYQLWSYLNQGNLDTATCAWTDDPANPDNCAFVRHFAIDLDAWASGNWLANLSRDAVDVNGDGNRDLVVVKHASGGNSRIPVTLLSGNGDGTFDLVAEQLFTHNDVNSGQSPVNTILFDDFDGDGLGDIIVGLDDDGDAGSAWFYPGVWDPTDGFSFDTSAAFEAFDLNPGSESGGDNAGVTSSARAFDFDFDGELDVIAGFNYTTAWSPPSHTVLLDGLGSVSFDTPTVLRDYPSSAYGQSFATPYRLCQRFSLTPQ